MLFPSENGSALLSPVKLGYRWYFRLAGYTMASKFPSLATVDLHSAGQRIARLEQFFQARKPAIYCELRPGPANCLGLKAQDSIAFLRDIGYRMYELDDSTGDVRDCAEVRMDLRDYLFLA